MELATLRILIRVILTSAVCASAITVAITISIAFINGGQTTVYINRFGEQYADLAFVVLTLAGAAMILRNEIRQLKAEAVRE